MPEPLFRFEILPDKMHRDVAWFLQDLVARRQREQWRRVEAEALELLALGVPPGQITILQRDDGFQTAQPFRTDWADA